MQKYIYGTIQEVSPWKYYTKWVIIVFYLNCSIICITFVFAIAYLLFLKKYKEWQSMPLIKFFNQSGHFLIIHSTLNQSSILFDKPRQSVMLTHWRPASLKPGPQTGCLSAKREICTAKPCGKCLVDTSSLQFPFLFLLLFFLFFEQKIKKKKVIQFLFVDILEQPRPQLWGSSLCLYRSFIDNIIMWPIPQFHFQLCFD